MTNLDTDETIDSAPHQVVLSPEQVALHFPVAGPTSRMLAYAIDLIVLMAIGLVVFVLVALATPLAGWIGERLDGLLPDPAADPDQVWSGFVAFLAVLLLIQLAFEMLYFVVLEVATGGRSIGKRVLGLRVVKDGGFPIGLRESLIRNLLRTADALPANYLVGLTSMVVSAQGKRLGDVAAGTVVIRLDRPAAAAPVPLEGDTGAFRFDRAQVARLGADGRALARQTLRRAEEVTPEKADELLARAVEVLRVRLGYEAVAPEDRRRFLRAVLAAGKR
jgi:uncharacterized RDD family membrane protein YckC